jgi:hypothetical protein
MVELLKLKITLTVRRLLGNKNKFPFLSFDGSLVRIKWIAD